MRAEGIHLGARGQELLKVSACRAPRGRREASGRLSSSESEKSEEEICSTSLVGDAASII